jgi:hypothetical protein
MDLGLQLARQLPHRRLQVPSPATFLRRRGGIWWQGGSAGGDVPPGNILEPVRVGHMRVA